MEGKTNPELAKSFEQFRHEHVWIQFTLRTKHVEQWTRFNFANSLVRVEKRYPIYTGWSCACGERGYAVPLT